LLPLAESSDVVPSPICLSFLDANGWFELTMVTPDYEPCMFLLMTLVVLLLMAKIPEPMIFFKSSAVLISSLIGLTLSNHLDGMNFTKMPRKREARPTPRQNKCSFILNGIVFIT